MSQYELYQVTVQDVEYDVESMDFFVAVLLTKGEEKLALLFTAIPEEHIADREFIKKMFIDAWEEIQPKAIEVGETF